jgi:hypothetical protein
MSHLVKSLFIIRKFVHSLWFNLLIIRGSAGHSLGPVVQDAGPFSHVGQVLLVSQSLVSKQMLLLESNVKSPHPSLAAHSAWQVQLELEMKELREEPTQRSGRKQNSQSKK